MPKKIRCLFALICMCGFGHIIHASPQMNAQDVTSSAPLIKSGRLYRVEAVGEVQGVSSFYIPGLVYIKNSKKIVPLGDIKLVEEILTAEGFKWNEGDDFERVLIKSVLLLYEGVSSRSLIDRHYYLARQFPDGLDTNALLRLQKICSEPKVTVDNGKWNIVLYQIRECIGECPVYKYSFGGTTSPFTISMVQIEHVNIVPAIILKEPLPR